MTSRAHEAASELVLYCSREVALEAWEEVLPRARRPSVVCWSQKKLTDEQPKQDEPDAMGREGAVEDGPESVLESVGEHEHENVVT